ncbi:AzlC family ABC transporter permease [Pseudoalteromonas xiamenensis]|uniref:AzlC family ABC transporter permease n=1 Tax=Pseudoalteromonas xiamenensis TaxID=882626 RepID=UPI0027E4DEDF|nr:AzlC family ABC transporter permease [Pseudoalteromonas xiamenensis]WMN58460.1 AzlC family ABC transporter permease [Pseudoalteromonas xiamenensis]
MSRQRKANYLAFWKGQLDMLPLNLAVVPWGILCGSLAVQNGFSPWEAQLMSLLVFAGSAQLVAIELIAKNTPLMTLLITVFIISARHFLYSPATQSGLSVRHKVKQKRDSPATQSEIACRCCRWSFVLTDELFAFSHHPRAYQTKARLVYALSAGFSFYVFWNIWTFIGVVAGSLLPDLTHLGLDFAIAATFIALVIPSIKNLPTLATVVTAGISATWFKSLGLELWLVFAALLSMSVGYGLSRGSVK